METIIFNINAYDASLSRENAIVRGLRKKKQEELQKLYRMMVAQKIEEYKGYTQEGLKPKPKTSPKEKQKKIIEIMEERGVQDPVKVLEEIKKIQRPKRIPIKKPAGKSSATQKKKSSKRSK